MLNRYARQRVALLTQHGKEKAIIPVLEPGLGCRIERVTGYDTDQLGTFTREIPRAGTQLEAARRKARVGMELSRLPLGLASEGSSGADPFAGMFPWNVEFLLFIDDLCGIEVVGMAQGNAVSGHSFAANWAEAASFARRMDFPRHYLVLRPESEDDPRLVKGISCWQELEQAFESALAQSGQGRVFMEIDLRAHANPTRMELIRRAAEDLLKKISSLCPICGVPGFWILERIAGLPCSECGSPTRETLREVWGCLKCSHRAKIERTHKPYADPGRCDYCNP